MQPGRRPIRVDPSVWSNAVESGDGSDRIRVLGCRGGGQSEARSRASGSVRHTGRLLNTVTGGPGPGTPVWRGVSRRVAAAGRPRPPRRPVRTVRSWALSPSRPGYHHMMIDWSRVARAALSHRVTVARDAPRPRPGSFAWNRSQYSTRHGVRHGWAGRRCHVSS